VQHLTAWKLFTICITNQISDPPQQCSLFKTLDVTEATRVELALQSSGDSSGLALSRLRDELFQLDVKQRQDALLLELQGADGDLDMNPIDVQAFTGELDAILAQFAAG
jgi:hypothetical protein